MAELPNQREQTGQGEPSQHWQVRFSVTICPGGLLLILRLILVSSHALSSTCCQGLCLFTLNVKRDFQNLFLLHLYLYRISHYMVVCMPLGSVGSVIIVMERDSLGAAYFASVSLLVTPRLMMTLKMIMNISIPALACNLKAQHCPWQIAHTTACSLCSPDALEPKERAGLPDGHTPCFQASVHLFLTVCSRALVSSSAGLSTVRQQWLFQTSLIMSVSGAWCLCEMEGRKSDRLNEQ